MIRRRRRRVLVGTGPKRRHGLEPPGSAADRGRPDRRQHRPLRVPEPGQAEHGHDHLELHPGEDPAAGPNYYTFSPTARYKINIDRNGDALPDVGYQFRFGERPGLLPRQHRPGLHGDASHGGTRRSSPAATTPPNNIGPRTTPNYRSLAARRSSTKAAARSSPASATTRSSPTSERSSTCSRFRKGTGNTGGGKDFFAGYAVHAHRAADPDLAARRRRTARSASGRPSSAPNVSVGGKHAGAVDAGLAARQPARQRGRRSRRHFKDAWNAGAREREESKCAGSYRTPILAAVINKLYPSVDAPERQPRRPRGRSCSPASRA